MPVTPTWNGQPSEPYLAPEGAITPAEAARLNSPTPGPWTARPATNALSEVFLGYWLIDGPNNAGVADLFGEVRGEQDEDGDDKRLPDAEIEANARLIAAAPDLLAAAQQMARSLNGNAGDFSGMLAAHRALDAAIAKATSVA